MMWLRQACLCLLVVGACFAQQKILLGGVYYNVLCPEDQKRVTLSTCGGTRGCTEITNYCSVLEVPYAKADRFQRPLPLTVDERSSFKKNRSSRSNSSDRGCMQIDPFSGQVTGQEECLAIDLYFPEEFTSQPSQKTNKLFVIIEGLEMKSYLGPHLKPSYGCDRFDYILAVVHYRVSALGFLSLENELAPPNLALFDQQMALQFLYNNSAALHTEPGSIVLLGFGSGAAFASFHMANSVSRKYFHRVLVSGGSALSPDATVLRPRTNAVFLAKQLNCTTENNETIIACLRNLDAKTLVLEVAKVPQSIRFAAFVDSNGIDQSYWPQDGSQHSPAFLTSPIDQLIEQSDFAEGMELVIYGYSTGAGLNHYLKSKEFAETTEDRLAQLQKYLGDYGTFEASRLAIAKASYYHYFLNKPKTSVELTGKVMVDILTDYLVGGPMQGTVLSHVRNRWNTTDIYVYLLQPALETDADALSLIKHLAHEGKVEIPSGVPSFGSSLDDLFIFIGCDKLPLFGNDNINIRGTLLRTLKDAQALAVCLSDPTDCATEQKATVKDGEIVLIQEILGANTAARDDNGQVYREEDNRFWASLRPMVVAFERSLDAERQRLEDPDVIKVAGGPGLWAAVGVLVAMTLVAIALGVVIIKMTLNRRQKKLSPSTETASPGGHHAPTLAAHYNSSMDAAQINE